MVCGSVGAHSQRGKHKGVLPKQRDKPEYIFLLAAKIAGGGMPGANAGTAGLGASGRAKRLGGM